ncbi:MAG: hypothetical protein M3Y74_14005 [Chloroflexota bacterium]|nr:hypothetical protein [Chloroflexota bacterium]
MISDDLVAAVAGDLAAFARLHEVSHQALLTAQAQAPSLILRCPALHHILATLSHDRRTTRTIQHWASFVRRGYIVPGDVPIAALDIICDAAHEDTMVDVISRLDELGDLIDGTIDDAELAMMLHQTEL